MVRRNSSAKAKDKTRSQDRDTREMRQHVRPRETYKIKILIQLNDQDPTIINGSKRSTITLISGRVCDCQGASESLTSDPEPTSSLRL